MSPKAKEKATYVEETRERVSEGWCVRSLVHQVLDLQADCETSEQGGRWCLCVCARCIAALHVSGSTAASTSEREYSEGSASPRLPPGLPPGLPTGLQYARRSHVLGKSILVLQVQPRLASCMTDCGCVLATGRALFFALGRRSWPAREVTYMVAVRISAESASRDARI